MTQVTWLTSPSWRWPAGPGSPPATGPASSTPSPPRETGRRGERRRAVGDGRPSGADPAVRHYSHDAWNSVTCHHQLPAKGAVLGALAPVLTPGEAGERRCFLVAYPILRPVRRGPADRDQRVGRRPRRGAARTGPRSSSGPGSATRPTKARGVDAKLARGNALTRPYAVCTVTVPKTARIAEYGRRLDAVGPPRRVRAAAAGPRPGRRRSPPPPSRSASA